MEYTLAIATMLGALAALWYFWDKYREKDKWHEEDRIVDPSWWESSDLKKNTDVQGFTCRWSNPERVEERIASGYSIIYYEDKNNKIKYRLINKGRQVLIGKKQESKRA